jgi:hypothetical protein
MMLEMLMVKSQGLGFYVFCDAGLTSIDTMYNVSITMQFQQFPAPVVELRKVDAVDVV